MKTKRKIKREIKFFLRDMGIEDDCKIHRIKIKRKRKVTIFLERPGIFIGMAGYTIKKFENDLGLKCQLIEFSPFKD